MPQMLQNTEADVQIIPIYPAAQIIPIEPPEPQFPSEEVPVLIIELERVTKPTLKAPQGAEWIMEQAAAGAAEPESVPDSVKEDLKQQRTV